MCLSVLTPKIPQSLLPAFKEKYHTESKQKWHFLTGTQSNIKTLTDSVGFQYTYNAKTGEYAHSAALIIITPEGRVSRYIRGIEYSPFTLKLAILEAIQEKFVSTIEKGLLYCYAFDSTENSYVLEAMAVMRIGAAFTVLGLILLFVILNRKKHRVKE